MWAERYTEQQRYIGEFDPKHQANLLHWLMKRAPEIELRRNESIIMRTFNNCDFSDTTDDMIDALLNTEGENPWEAVWQAPFVQALQALVLGSGGANLVQAWENVVTCPLEHVRKQSAVLIAAWPAAQLVRQPMQTHPFVAYQELRKNSYTRLCPLCFGTGDAGSYYAPEICGFCDNDRAGANE